MIEGTKEFPLNFADAFDIELHAFPGGSVGDQVPPGGIGAELGDGLKGIDDVAESFGHFIAVLVQHEAVANDRLIGQPGISRLQVIDPPDPAFLNSSCTDSLIRAAIAWRV